MNFLSTHSIFTGRLFILLGAAFALSVVALWPHRTRPRLALILGAIAAIAAILHGVLQTVIVLEWVAIALLLCYVVLLGVQTKRLSSAGRERMATTTSR